MKPATLSTTEKFAKLWVHEIQRVFYDRLVNDENDRQWFRELITKLV